MGALPSEIYKGSGSEPASELHKAIRGAGAGSIGLRAAMESLLGRVGSAIPGHEERRLAVLRSTGEHKFPLDYELGGQHGWRVSHDRGGVRGWKVYTLSTGAVRAPW